MNRARGGSRRPNRGGGRFNKPRTFNRAGLSGLSVSIEKEQDELDEREDDDHFVDSLAEINEPSHEGKNTMPAKTKSKFRNKALIQRLDMSADNQQMIEEVLQYLQITRSSHKFNEKLTLDAREIRRNEAYWQKVGEKKLMIEDVKFADQNETDAESVDDIYSSYAVKKLLQCGFEKKRCIDALRENDGDLGAALQLLLCSCCELNQLGKDNPDYTEEKFQEAVLQRQEEAMALASIYEETFSEVIPDCVWNIKLSLPFLQEAFKPKKEVQNKYYRSKTDKKTEIPENVCRFFLKGFCRFGDKCRLSHIVPDRKTNSIDTRDDIPEVKSADNIVTDLSFPFNLEVRFPKDSLYPFEPPMVAFYSTHELIPSAGCLNVTIKLSQEAKVLCSAESPAIFCLTNLLENEEEIMECFKLPPSEFSLPPKNKDTLQSIGAFSNNDDKKGVTSGKVQTNEPQQSPDELTVQEKNKKLKQQFVRLQVKMYFTYFCF